MQLLINAIARFGGAARVNGTLPDLLGSPARDLDDYLQDRRRLWT